MERVLITGVSGRLGSVLARRFSGYNDFVGVARREGPGVTFVCDLTDRDAVIDMIRATKPSLVIHAAALTDVDACEENPNLAWRQNVVSTKNLAHSVSYGTGDCRIVYVSTDHVYDDFGPSEEAASAPRNIYALTKLWGEDLVLRRESSLVCRVNFFGAERPGAGGIIDWLEKACFGAFPATLFRDVFFNPLYAEDLADAMLALIEAKSTGVVNIGAHGCGASKAAFLRAVARGFGLADVNLRDGSVNEANLSAYRPRDMRMAIGRAEQLIGKPLPTLDASLKRYILERSKGNL